MSTVKIGIAGWSYPDWKGLVYPENKKIDQLEYISSFVDCIEINNTFYHPPSAKNAKSWIMRTEHKEGFYFTAKLHRDITHANRIDSEMVKMFHKGFEPFIEAGKLKHLLAQFKWNFNDTVDNRGQLGLIVRNFCDSFNIVFELRHRSWQQNDALKFLKELGVGLCNLDYPTTHNSFDMPVSAVGKAGYFRLHGRNKNAWFDKNAGRDETYNYYYDHSELKQIKHRVKQILEAFESLTVIANNHYKGSAVANAIELKAMLTNKSQPVPEPLAKAYPDLAEFALD